MFISANLFEANLFGGGAGGGGDFSNFVGGGGRGGSSKCKGKAWGLENG